MKTRVVEYGFHIGDLLGGTSHLDNFQFGAYMRLLLVNIQKGELPQDPYKLRTYARCTEKQWQKLWPLIEEKFTIIDGAFTNKRVREKIGDITASSDAARAKALKRWKSRDAAALPQDSLSNANLKPIEEDTSVSSPPPTPQGGVLRGPKTISYGDMTFDQVFDFIWKIYPAIRDKGHKGKAREQLAVMIAKGGRSENDWRDCARVIAEGVRRFARYCDQTGERNPDLFRWLRDEGYNRPWSSEAGAGRGQGYTLEAVHSAALADKTRRPEGRKERLERLGLGDDAGHA